MSVEAPLFRSALGRFASGVTVVTTSDGDQLRFGVTISAFTSLSLDPPLILFCLGRASEQIEDYKACSRFTVNLLAEEQMEVSELFASQLGDKFNRVAWSETADGYIILDDCLAALKCERDATYPAGDHVIFIGKVRGIEGLTHEADPLLRYRGAYHCLGRVLEG